MVREEIFNEKDNTYSIIDANGHTIEIGLHPNGDVKFIKVNLPVSTPHFPETAPWKKL